MRTTAQLYQEIIDELAQIDVDEGYQNGRLERAMDYFCTDYDKGHGMREAIRQTLHDQLNKHWGAVDENELSRLLELLTQEN